MTRPFALAAALLASAGSSGCFDLLGTDCEGFNCSPCPPPGVYVEAFDSATGAAIEGVVVEGAACAFQVGPACVLPYRNGVGEYDLVVSAPGYAPKTVHVVEVPAPIAPTSCCPPCGATTSANVTLDPL
jgi:hypothetical protein